MALDLLIRFAFEYNFNWMLPLSKSKIPIVRDWVIIATSD